MHRPPPLDPECEAVLAAAPWLTASLTPERIAPLRIAAAKLRPTAEDLCRNGAIDVEEHDAETADGHRLAITLLRPRRHAGPRPGLCYFHGGGMVAGDRWTGLSQVLDYVEQLGIVVASAEYRLAPEHPYPQPLDDCFAALQWLDSMRTQLALDDGGLILAGTSAGGGLAAGVAVRVAERGGPRLSDLVLSAPMLDDRARFPSSVMLDGSAPWDRHSNRTGWQALLGKTADGHEPPAEAAPARASDLSGLPPLFVDVGSIETFRDEAIDFATRAAQDGIAVELHVWGGAFHGFESLAPDSAVAKDAGDTRLRYLRRRLRHRSPP